MAGVSYIGKPISLVSHSDIRYRGILHGIDPAASTISLANVISMGTENRRPAEAYIPPSDVPYEFIIFRASEVKDIAVDQTPDRQVTQTRNVHDDPAVMTASAPPPAPPQRVQDSYAQRATPVSAPQLPPAGQAPAESGEARGNSTAPPAPKIQEPQLEATQSSRSADGAATGMANVERAMGELRVSNTNTSVQSNAKGSRRGGRALNPTIRAGEISIPATEFDFTKSNARFDKVGPNVLQEQSDGEGTNPSDDDQNDKSKDSKVNPIDNKAYNPKASFFDSLGSGTLGAPLVDRDQNRGGYGGRGRRGSSRREEERQRNVATFGETGDGPGLLGPGAYVSGWGGGRRGQGRGGRRGGGGGRQGL